MTDPADVLTDPPLSARLIRARARDGLTLTGALLDPDHITGPLVLWVHGTGCGFHDRAYLRIGPALTRRGYPFLTVDTRGRDCVVLHADSRTGVPAPLGAVFEDHAESVADVGTWLEAASALGFGRVVLAGHSSGAGKVVIQVAGRTGDERVVGVVLASPPVWWPANAERIALARQMVADGRGRDLMPARDGDPSWYVISAHALVSRFDVVEHAMVGRDGRPAPLAALWMPVLALYGSAEHAEEELAVLARTAPRTTTRVVDGADHSYLGHEEQIAATIADWLDGTLGAAT